MNARGARRLYDLLPAVYRTRDAEQGEPLRRLLAVMEEELQGIEDDISGLFENWFIETCEEWVVPYIGDLLGVTGLHPGTPESFSLRGHVANTLAYRRRKGTAAVLEQVAVDTTGWRAHVVEAFQHLAVSAHVNHPRVSQPAVLSVRNIDALQYVDGPFDTTFRSVDVRHVESGAGRFNLPHVALWMWRLQVLETNGAAARSLGGGRWSLDPWSFRDTDGVQLFNRARSEDAITQLTQPQHVPGPLLRLPLYREVEAVAIGESVTRAWFLEGDQEPVVAIRYLPTGGDPYTATDWRSVLLGPVGVATGQGLAICHLGERTEPFPSAGEFALLRDRLAERGRIVGLDPVTGRLLFQSGFEPAEVIVDIATGTPGRLGGGAYRSDEGFDLGAEAPSFLGFVTRERAPSAFTTVEHNWVFSSLSDALTAWEAHLELWRAKDRNAWHDEYGFDGARGVIVIADSRIYDEPDLVVAVPPLCRLSIVSAQWSRLATELTEELERDVVRELVPGGVRPHVRANIATANRPATWPPIDTDVVERGALTIHGLHLEGRIESPSDALGSLSIAHVTVAHDAASLGGSAVEVRGGLESMDLCLIRSAVLGLTVHDVVNVKLDGCVVDGAANDQVALQASDATVAICSSTIRGLTIARTLSASDTLFTGSIDSKRRQEGCLRFCFIPAASRTPRRFRCQPDLSLGEAAHFDAERDQSAARMLPAFVSTAIGDAAYFQLAPGTAEEILTGAEDGAEMGGWHHLRQPQRAANLRASLITYLRFGLEAGGFHAT